MQDQPRKNKTVRHNTYKTIQDTTRQSNTRKDKTRHANTI